MIATHSHSTFDTHSFIKSLLAAKTDEDKYEIIAKVIAEVKDESY